MQVEELREIMLRHTASLIRTAYYYVKDLQVAEDIVQEVFIKFYNAHQSYEDRGELRAYLTKLTVNKSKDYLKSWAYRKIHLYKKLAPSSKEDQNHLVKKDEENIIGKAILDLPLRQREVLIYFYFKDMTISEVSAILSIPESTVKTRLRRGKDLLRDKLKGIEWEVLLHE